MNFEYRIHSARPPPGWFFCAILQEDEVIFIAKRENYLTISVPFPDEKSQALTLYLEQNGEDLERCMVDSVEQLYRKTVPVAIRKYIDATLKKQNPEPEKPPAGSENRPEGPNGF